MNLPRRNITIFRHYNPPRKATSCHFIERVYIVNISQPTWPSHESWPLSTHHSYHCTTRENSNLQGKCHRCSTLNSPRDKNTGIQISMLRLKKRTDMYLSNLFLKLVFQMFATGEKWLNWRRITERADIINPINVTANDTYLQADLQHPRFRVSRFRNGENINVHIVMLLCMSCGN